MELAASAWTFGWEALVAIGTLGLAGATALLAQETRTLARETAEDIRAEWRPVLHPILEQAGRIGYWPNQNTGTFLLRLENSGHGPALNVRGECVTETQAGRQVSPKRRFGPVAQGRALDLQFNDVLVVDVSGSLDSHATFTLNVSYDDIAGRTYKSTVQFADPQKGQRQNQAGELWIELISVEVEREGVSVRSD